MTNVSIVTYKTPADELDQCLRLLEQSDAERVYVIDNAREKRVSEVVARYGKCEYIANENTGYGSAHNIALRRSIADGADYHLVLNSDVTFDPEVISALTAYLDSHPEVGAIQPKIVYADGRMQYSCRRLPTPLDVFGRRFLPARWMKSRNSRYLLQDLDLTEIQNPPYHQGSFMMMRMDALKRVGVFDERFFMYPEDIDLTRRIHAKYKTLYYPRLTVVHNHRAASYHDMRMTLVHMVNMIKYFNKWGWFIDPERRRFNRETGA